MHNLFLFTSFKNMFGIMQRSETSKMNPSLKSLSDGTDVAGTAIMSAATDARSLRKSPDLSCIKNLHLNRNQQKLSISALRLKAASWGMRKAFSNSAIIIH